MRRRFAATRRRAAFAACLALAACAAPPPASVLAPAAVAAAPLQLAQLGRGREATFGWCRGADCPQRTAKTLSTAPAPATPAPPPARVAPADSIAEGEALVGASARPPWQAPPSEVREAPAPQEVSVQFPLASARLGNAARDALRAIAPQLRQASEVRLSGRTDNTGPSIANDALARERAEAVRRELLGLVPGIAWVLTVEAQGGCCFIASNDRAAGRARNRRVDIVYRLELDDPP